MTSYAIAEGSVTSYGIANGTIVNDDISGSAAIDPTKLAANGNTITAIEFGYLDGTTANIQSQFEALTGSAGAVLKSTTSAQVIQPSDDVTPLSLASKSSGTSDVFRIQGGDSADMLKVEQTGVGNLWLKNNMTVDGVDVSTHAAGTHHVHGVAGNVVGTTDSQTLTNKTLSSGSTWNGNTIADGYIDSTIARDSELATHAAVATSVHGVTVL